MHFRGARGGAVAKALASHLCAPSSNPGVEAICGLSLLLVLSFPARDFSPATPVFPSPHDQKSTFANSNSIRNRVDEDVLPPNYYYYYYYYYYYCYHHHYHYYFMTVKKLRKCSGFVICS